MQIDHECRGDVVISSIIGELDTPEAPQAWDQLLEVLAFEPRAVILDLGRCTYIGSAGVSLVIRLVQELRKIHAPLRIANVPPRLTLVLDVLSVASLVPIDPTIAQAIHSLTVPPRAQSAPAA